MKYTEIVLRGKLCPSGFFTGRITTDGVVGEPIFMLPWDDFVDINSLLLSRGHSVKIDYFYSSGEEDDVLELCLKEAESD